MVSQNHRDMHRLPDLFYLVTCPLYNSQSSLKPQSLRLNIKMYTQKVMISPNILSGGAKGNLLQSELNFRLFLIPRPIEHITLLIFVEIVRILAINGEIF